MLADSAPIRPLDIPFKRAPILARSSSGLPYLRWVTYGMPQLGQYQFLLDVVFFLYPDEESARQGRKAGGTGFFVGLPSEVDPDHLHHLYAVSNWHVAVCGRPPCPVIRVNKRSGPPEIFPFEPCEWTFLPNFHDIAVVPIALDPRALKAQALEASSFFLTKEVVASQEINAGEDVFMLGRFMDYDGVEANCPSMRFGNISMMEAIVKQPTGFLGPSLVVDMHSRTGFSGSPVFVYRTTGSIFSHNMTIVTGGHLMKLLGILWGQFTEAWDLEGAQALQVGQTSAPATWEGGRVKGWSGMSLVSPASAIMEVLNEPKLKEQRSAFEAELSRRLSGTAAPMAE
jgi:hypothetical protein